MIPLLVAVLLVVPVKAYADDYSDMARSFRLMELTAFVLSPVIIAVGVATSPIWIPWNIVHTSMEKNRMRREAHKKFDWQWRGCFDTRMCQDAIKQRDSRIEQIDKMGWFKL